MDEFSRRKAWGARVRAERKRRGLTQAKFGQLLGVHVLTVSRWERGEMDALYWRQRQLAELEAEAVADA